MQGLSTAIGVIAVCGSVIGQTPTKAFEDIGYGELMERWQRAAQEYGAPGAAIAFVKDGEIAAIEAFGEREAGLPATPDSMYYIASATKPFVAAAISRLAQQGRIDLDAPVRTYLPKFQVASEEASGNVTVRELLSHSRGLSSGPIVLLDAYTGEITEERFYRWLREVEPTETLEYTNLHFTLLGRVIEAVTGQSWQEHLDQAVFTPAGMHRTTAYASEMYGDADAAFPMIEGPDGFRVAEQVKNDSVMHAAGGLGTSAADGAKWLLLHLNGGVVGDEQVLPKAAVTEMQKLQAAYPQTEGQVRAMDGFGLAWQVGTWRGKTPYITHSGGYVGTAAHFSFLPERGIGVVVLCNASPAGQALCDVVSIDLYERELGMDTPLDLLDRYAVRLEQIKAEQGEAASPRLTAQDLSIAPAAYVGRYSNQDLGTLDVFFDRGTLTARLGMMPGKLSGKGTDAFEVAFAESTAAGEFEVESGRVTGVTLHFDGGLDAAFKRSTSQ